MGGITMNWNFDGADINTIWTAIVLLGIGYLFGSFLFSRFYISVFKKGDDTYVDSEGNRKRMPRFGTSWTWRVHGPKIAITHFLFDLSKSIIGYWAVVYPLQLLVPQFATAIPLFYFAGILIGNNWPIWWKFEGGVGVVAALGSAFAINWVAALIGWAMWGVALKFTKQTGLSALLGVITASGLFFVPYLNSNPIFTYPPIIDLPIGQLTYGLPLALLVPMVLTFMVIRRKGAWSSYARLFKKLVTLNFKKTEIVKQDKFHSVDDE